MDYEFKTMRQIADGTYKFELNFGSIIRYANIVDSIEQQFMKIINGNRANRKRNK